MLSLKYDSQCPTKRKVQRTQPLGRKRLFIKLYENYACKIHSAPSFFSVAGLVTGIEHATTALLLLSSWPQERQINLSTQMPSRLLFRVVLLFFESVVAVLFHQYGFHCVSHTPAAAAEYCTVLYLNKTKQTVP